jgi:hypothetical protein
MCSVKDFWMNYMNLLNLLLRFAFESASHDWLRGVSCFQCLSILTDLIILFFFFFLAVQFISTWYSVL